MRFWDSSAIVPLLVTQPATSIAEALLDEVPDMVVWWHTPLECTSAFARMRREAVISIAEESRLHITLDALRDACLEIQPTDNVRTTARRLLRTHALRSGDALQLAAAMEWAGVPADHVLVTFDERLRDAARIEGFVVLPAS